MINLLKAIGCAIILSVIIYLIANGINWLVHWDSDIPFYVMIGFVFIVLVVTIFIELNKKDTQTDEIDLP